MELQHTKYHQAKRADASNVVNALFCSSVQTQRANTARYA